MEIQDIRTLRLLEAVEGEQNPSQRELAASLNVSLGLVNSFLKRLARKGYFKITNLPANRVRYLLTPKGMAEKTRLTYEYIQYSIGYYRQARSRLQVTLARLASQGQRRIVFWGQGELAEIAYISLQQIPELEFICLVTATGDDDFFGRKVLAPDQLGTVEYDLIMITAISSVDEIRSKVDELRIPSHVILFLQ